MKQLLERVVFGKREAARRESTRLMNKVSVADVEVQFLDTQINEILKTASDDEDEKALNKRAVTLANLRSKKEIQQHLYKHSLKDFKAAQIEVRRAEAADLFEAANAKRAEMTKISEKAAPLLQKLGDLEGIQFDASILAAQRGGRGWFGVRRAASLPMELRSPNEVVADRVSGEYLVPQSRILFDEIVTLERKAAEILSGIEKESDAVRAQD